MNKRTVKQFNSIADMRNWVESKINLAMNRGYIASCREYQHGTTWYGFPSHNDAVSALSHGDPIGAAQVETLAQRLKTKLPRAQGHKRVKMRGDEGDELDMDYVYRGDLSRAWEGTRREIRRGSGIIRLMVDIGGNSVMTSNELRWRGIAGLALSGIITKAGYSVEILAGFAVREVAAGLDTACTVAVKPRNAKINLGRLSASLGSPALFRTLGFEALIKSADDAGLVASKGLGFYRELSVAIPVPQTITQIMVPGMVKDEPSAIHWIEQAIKLLEGA